MAATVSSPWGKPGAWALDAEAHEDELNQQQSNSPHQNDDESDFPSLSAAAANKQPKKKKNQALTLAEFASYGASSQPPTRLTHDDLLNLPTGPRQRSAEELDRSRLGGGFKSYGMSSRNGEDSGNSRWVGGGGAANSRVSSRDRDTSREFGPSRADEIDDWSKTKKVSSFGNERRERGSSFFDSQSKADEVDSWVANKPVESRRFSNEGFERRGSFGSLSRDRNVFGNVGGGGGGSPADSDTWGRKKDESDGIGSGSSRPKLVLQPRSLPVANNESNGVAAKPKGSNPFGDARPREEVLAEKGKDWKEIDEKLESVKISNNKEVEKGERPSARWSLGNGRGGSSGSEPRTWRKPDVVDSNSRPESSDGNQSGSGDASEGN